MLNIKCCKKKKKLKINDDDNIKKSELELLFK